MIFKIVGNFDEVDFEKLLNRLSSIFEFIYLDESLFIALRKWTDYDLMNKTIKAALKPAKFFVVKEINEFNLGKENPEIVKWCRDNFVELDKQRFEIEQQERLKCTMTVLDECERILASRKKEALKKDREEEKNGRTKTQRKAKETN